MQGAQDHHTSNGNGQPKAPRQRTRKPKQEGGAVPATGHAAPPAPPVKRIFDTESNDNKKKPRRGGRRNKPSSDGGAAPTHAPRAKQDDVDDEEADDAEEEEAAAPSVPKTMDHLSDVLFSSLAISDKTKRAIVDDLKYERLTHVQNETFSLILDGKDVLAKAKTGNGKTIAFLLPVIENMIREGRRPKCIPVLVISPTRELAIQIATEARRLTKFHSLSIACFVGGSSIGKDVKTLTSSTPLDILIATPGRLLDHIGQNTGELCAKLSKTGVLILDEADRLLDMGFRPEIMKIIAVLPKQRQTLLFSATLPASTEELKRVALRGDYAFVDTIDEDDHQTNVQTVQECIVCNFEQVFPVAEQVLTEHMKLPQYKVMAFLPTARAAQFAAQLFIEAGFPNVLEIHSRKSQSARTKAADAFRSGKKVIMFSSDVSARGVDYPDVSLVLQIGLTDRDQYIHRLGRTARAGMEGRGILVLADFEKPFLKDLSDLPIEERSVPAGVSLQSSRVGRVIANLKRGSELEKSAQQSYQAWLGFYNGNVRRLKIDKARCVALAAQYSVSVGLDVVPQLEKRTLGKMGLLGVAGIEPAPYVAHAGSGRVNGGGRGGGGSGRGGGRGGGGGFRR
ncbi:Dead/deah box RNA helicase [Globisporangium polare]